MAIAGTVPRSSPPPAERRAWFAPQTLASWLQVSDRMIRKWVAQGRLRSYKIDGRRRFDPEDVDEFIAQFLDEKSVKQCGLIVST